MADDQNTQLTKTRKLTVNPLKCIKCGTCVAMYPDLFEFAPDGSIQVKKDANFEGKNLEQIKDGCASAAIEEQ